MVTDSEINEVFTYHVEEHDAEQERGEHDYQLLHAGISPALAVEL